MTAKRARDIKGMHSLNARPAPKGVRDIKGVRDTKGMRSRNTGTGLLGLDLAQGLLKRNTEQVQKNLSSVRDTVQDNLQSGLSLTQSKLQAGVSAAHDALGKGTQSAGERLKNVGRLPHTLQEMLVRRALQIGVRAVRKRTSKRMKKARENVERLPHALQETLQTGVSAAQDALGKGAQQTGESAATQRTSKRMKKAQENNVGSLPDTAQETLVQGAQQTGESAATQRVSKRLKKAQENVEHLPHTLEENNVGSLPDTAQETLVLGAQQTGESAATQRASEPLKKAQENVGRLPHALQEMLQTGVSAAQDVLGKGAQRASKPLKAVHLLTERGGHRQASRALFEAGQMLHEQLKKKEVSPTMQEQYKLVRRYHERSLAIDEELQDKDGIAANLEALVDVTLVEGDYAAADQYLNRVVQLLIEQGNQKQASVALFNAARRIYKQLEERESADEGKDEDKNGKEAKGEAEQ